MNWFENLVADLINLLANGIQGLSGMGLGQVILDSIFPDYTKAPTLGTGWFSDIMSTRALQSLGPLAQAFWILGWAFFSISIYFFAMQIASSSNSAIQRDRLKQGAVRILLTAVMLWQGPRLALLISQGFFYGTEYLLSSSGSLSSNMSGLNDDGGQALINSSVHLFSSIMALIVWVIYEFRKIFLYAWMIFFPLAMAFYANDKTRNVAKMWWWEWVYQMAIPLGQALVYGIAVAVANPGKGAALTASDVFAGLAGVIGLISSAVYVRKVMDAIAQNFGASVMGFNGGERLGQLAAMGAAFGIGDMAGKLGVKGAAKAVGKPLKFGFQKADGLLANKAKKTVEKNPELFSQAIGAGAGIDDIMLHHQAGAFGDTLKAGGAGLESAAAGTRGHSHGSHQHRSRSGTVNAVRDVGAGVKSTVANSNLGLIVKGSLHNFKTSGGIAGRAGKATASAITKTPGLNAVAGNKAHNYLARGEAKQQRLMDMRKHMNSVMSSNAAAQRLPNVNHLYDSDKNGFTGQSAAQQKYSGARNHLSSTLQQSMSINSGEANNMIAGWERSWDSGKHPATNSYTPEVQSAYRQAFSHYGPASLDAQTKSALQSGAIQHKPHMDQHTTIRHGANAMLNDARRAMVQGR